MKYNNIKKAIFLERPNRFIAYVKLEGERVCCHVKNTGRCKELLIPNKSVVYVQDHGTDNNRKTRYSLITVKKGKRLINIDSQVPNKLAVEWMKQSGLYEDVTLIKPEKKFGSSRFDIYYERANGQKGFMEVKGVTLEENNVVKFPDAPTIRGVKHIYELIAAKNEGYEANILFVVQLSDVDYFIANEATHPEFKVALDEAKNNGVNVMAIDCKVTKNEIIPGKLVEVK